MLLGHIINSNGVGQSVSDIPIIHWVEILAPDVPSDAVGQQSSLSKPEVIKGVLDGGHNMLAIGALILPVRWMIRS